MEHLGLVYPTLGISRLRSHSTGEHTGSIHRARIGVFCEDSTPKTRRGLPSNKFMATILGARTCNVFGFCMFEWKFHAPAFLMSKLHPGKWNIAFPKKNHIESVSAQENWYVFRVFPWSFQWFSQMCPISHGFFPWFLPWCSHIFRRFSQWFPNEIPFNHIWISPWNPHFPMVFPWFSPWNPHGPGALPGALPRATGALRAGLPRPRRRRRRRPVLRRPGAATAWATGKPGENHGKIGIPWGKPWENTRKMVISWGKPWEKPWENGDFMGKTMGKPWENHGKIGIPWGKPWENTRKMVISWGKPWENHRKMGISWGYECDIHGY